MKKRFLPILLVLSMLIPMLLSVQVFADGTDDEYGTFDSNTSTYHITTAQQLINISNNSKGDNPTVLGYNFVLDNDIDVSEYDAQINIGSIPLTGDSHPFFGTFDGNGHTISGLTFTAENSSDAGLFAYTDGAIIKNLVIADAYIKSARRGGIVVGKAVNTQFYNVTVSDSKLEMFTNGSVIELITGLGISGGAIAGTMEESENPAANANSKVSVMYNCESRDTSVITNTASGAQVLSGDGIYIGGLAGYSKDSTIEYSRVIRGEVNMRFDIVVGALGGKVLYAGGITGGMEGSSKTIDCFATTPVSISSINAVAVGSGTICYTAGITGAAYGSSAIERCHYSGVLYSYLYNSILVIPIILTNRHIYGLVGKNDSFATITSSYFDYDRAMTDKDYSKVSIPAVCDREDNANAGSKPREQYISQLVWSNKGYDFTGTTQRTSDADKITEVGSNHYNKWVMDYETEMPVHGSGVTVGTDFPNAGTVTIGKSALRDPVSFTEGSRTQIISVNDPTLELSQSENGGYNFKGWYEGTVDSAGNVSKTEDTPPLGTENIYTINNPADNSAYVASYTANVVFKNPNGNDVIVEYTYNQPLELNNKLFEYNNQTLIGWNTTGTITDATSDQINNTTFIQAGIPVTEPMTLYPVFVGVGSNINAVFEQTGTSVATDTRLITKSGSDNKGWYVSYTYKGEENTEPGGYMFDGWYQIPYSESVLGSPISLNDAVCVSRDKKYYVNEDYYTNQYLYVAKFKYRVTAWMPVEYHQLPAVSWFYYRNYSNYVSNYVDQGKFAELWANHGDTAASLVDQSVIKEPDLIIPTPAMGEGEKFRYWTADSSVVLGDDVYSDGELNALSNEQFASNITNPIDLYGLVEDVLYYHTSISAFSDFPNAVGISDTYSSNNLKTTVELKQNYNFYDISHYQENTLEARVYNIFGYNPASGETSFDISRLNYYQNYILVRAAADVDFHDKKGNLITTGGDFTVYNNPNGWNAERTVTRKYQSLLFGDTVTAESKFDNSVTPSNCFSLISNNNTPVGVGTTPSLNGDDVKTDNYKFLGWVNKAALREVDSKYLYDYKETPAEGSDETPTPEQNVTSDSKKAEGYVLTKDDRVYAYMDIYPLYAKYKVTLADNLGESEKKPNNNYTVTDDGIITITPDNQFDGGVKEIIGTNSKGETVTLTKGAGGTWSNTAENPLDVDEKYTFTVSYEFTVKYNKVKGDQETVELKREYGETVGETYEPSTSAPTDKIFAGWVNQDTAPEKGYVEYTSYDQAAENIVTEDTVVTSDMDLYPAYTAPNITTTSNIDTESNKYASSSVNGGKVTITARSETGYKFAYWQIIQNDETKYYSSTSSTELSSSEAVSGAVFKAVYNPVFTYMIPNVDSEGNATDYPSDKAITGTISYGTEFAGGSTEAIQAVTAALENSNYTFVGWTTTQGGTDEYTNENVTAPVTLYPILQEAIIVTYEYKTTDGKDTSHKEKYTKAGNITLLYLGDYSYTDEDGEHIFTGWTTEDNSFYTGGSEYTLTKSITFTAQWSDSATSYTVWSNISDKNTTVNISSSGDCSYFPAESQLSAIAPATDSKTTFIGYALVTINGDSRTCDGLYAAGDTVPTATLSEYNTDTSSTKRIYAVWAQVETLPGGQMRLDSKSGMRVMGIVNTTILERVGLNTPDTDYERHMMFAADSVLSGIAVGSNDYSYFMNAYHLGEGNYSDIKAKTKAWYGNDHHTKTSSDNNTFSIIAQMDNNYYAQNWAYRAYLTFTYEDEATKRAYGTFSNSSNMRSVQEIAKSFISDLEKQGGTHKDYLGLGKESYDLLMQYAGRSVSN